MTKKTTNPRQALIDMAQGFFRGKTLCAAVRLEIADALADRTRSVEELAEATGANRDSLPRLLRALAAMGVLEEHDGGRYSLSALGQPLRRDAPDSIWASIVFWGDLIADAWTYLGDCVSQGEGTQAEDVMVQLGRKSRWATEPDPTAIFHAVFAEPSAKDYDAFAAAYDFSSSRLVADLGGAGGGLLSAILLRHPKTHGLLIDRKEAVAKATSRFASSGLSDRCEARAGDLFTSIPTEPDLYVLKSVLHGYQKSEATKILENCRAVMSNSDRLLLFEVVLPNRIEGPDPALESLFLADLNMLAVTGGRERNASEWRELLESADLELLRTLPVSGSNLIEAAPHK